MSDVSQGPGWWRASDGKWYPPQTAPSPGLPAPPAGPAARLAGDGGAHDGGVVGASVDAKGLVGSLYDFQFDHFVTPKLIRFFYGFFVVVLTLGAAIFAIGALASGDAGTAVGGLIFIPIGYFLYLIFGRMYFELVAALFRVADDLRAIRRNTDR